MLICQPLESISVHVYKIINVSQCVCVYISISDTHTLLISHVALFLPLRILEHTILFPPLSQKHTFLSPLPLSRAERGRAPKLGAYQGLK